MSLLVSLPSRNGEAWQRHVPSITISAFYGRPLVLCRNVNTADEYFLHNVSMTYRADTFSIGFGVRNVFDKNPPRIDTASVFGSNNVPLGAGYDLNGRRIFANFTKTF